jgi:flagellar assembly factor FliW
MQTITESLNAAKNPIISAPSPKTIKIQSRFGDIEVETASKITFKHGLLGIPEAVSFCLTELPHIKTDQFKLLQCMDDKDLSFIVVPSQYDNQLLESSDLEEACKVLGYDKKSLVVLFIVTVHEGADRHLSVNAKAPILIDAAKRSATQYVFQNTAYAIQHRIS